MMEVPLENWQKFTEWVDQIHYGRLRKPQAIFRGHSKSEWQLSHTLKRTIVASRTHNPSMAKVLALEDFALKSFEGQAHLLLPSSIINRQSNLIARWAIMQHHWAPTRLLDWTYSPYVAAYFAVIADPEADGAVFYFDAQRLAGASERAYKEEAKLARKDSEIRKRFLTDQAKSIIHLVAIAFKNDRMIAQQGLFTVSDNVLADHEDILETMLPATSTDASAFQKWIIPAKEKGGFLKKLRIMNVTASSLFPGLDGVGRGVAEAIRVDAREAV